jgi:hypothetical protein
MRLSPALRCDCHINEACADPEHPRLYHGADREADARIITLEW